MEERLQRTSWLATAEEPKGWADARQTLRRDAKHVEGLVETKEGMLAEKDRKPGGKKPEKTTTKDERRKTAKRRDRQRSYNSHNQQRRLGPKGGPRREGTEIRPSHEGGEEEQHKAESQGGQETETEKATSKPAEERNISTQAHAKENRRRENEPSQGRKRKENEGREGDQNNSREEPPEGSGIEKRAEDRPS